VGVKRCGRALHLADTPLRPRFDHRGTDINPSRAREVKVGRASRQEDSRNAIYLSSSVGNSIHCPGEISSI